ncbi:MAG: ArnT family glycosyltransferase [Candidatus Brocadiia bacterium]
MGKQRRRGEAAGAARLRMASLAVFVVALGVAVVTLDDPGLTWDEPFSILAGRSYAAWLGKLGSLPFDEESIAAHWRTNCEHPPLAKVLMGLSQGLLGQGVSVLGARMAVAVLFALLVELVFRFGVGAFGGVAGACAAASLLCMPRVFGHGRLAALDVPMALTWLLAVAAFARAVGRGWGWSVLSGLCLGLALLTKINAVFIPLVLVAWGLAAHRARAIRPLVLTLAVGAATFVAGWPWLWHDTAARLWLGYDEPGQPTAYLRPQGRTPVPVRYLGRNYAHGHWWLRPEEVRDWPGLCARLRQGAAPDAPAPLRRLRDLLGPAAREAAAEAEPSPAQRTALVNGLNEVLARRDFYRPGALDPADLPAPARELARALEADPQTVPHAQVVALNRRLLEAALPHAVARSLAATPPPFHYPLVMAFATLPLGILFLVLLGLVHAVRGFRREPLLALVVGNAAVALGVFMTPWLPRYDGVRLFLPAFPFLALLAGVGASRCWDATARRWPKRPWRPLFLAVVFFLSQAGATVLIHPYELSYYNGAVGGLWGAERLGFETTYWHDVVDRRVFAWLNRRCVVGQRVAFYPVGEFVVSSSSRSRDFYETFYLSRAKRLEAVRLEPGAPWDFLVLNARKPMLLRSPQARRLWRSRRPVFAVRKQGVLLAAVYEREWGR